MPTRPTKLYLRTNNMPPVTLATGGITRIQAAYRWQFTLHLRDNWRIVTDSRDRFVVRRGEDVVECWIDSEPPTPRK